jgi:predicted helicase
MSMTFEEASAIIHSRAANTRDLGTAFERLTVFFLKNDPLWSQRFSDVWMWSEAPTNDGQDIGIDLVARDSRDGSYWAIQCKFYDDQSTLDYKALSTFFANAAAKQFYEHYLIIDTASEWTSNLRRVAGTAATGLLA